MRQLNIRGFIGQGLIATIIILSSAHGQKLQIEVLGGYSDAKYQTVSDVKLKLYQPRRGFSAGINSTYYPLKFLGFGAGVQYLSESAIFGTEESSVGTYVYSTSPTVYAVATTDRKYETKYDASYLNIPVYATLRHGFGDRYQLRFSAGTVVGMLLNGTMDYKYTSITNKYEPNNGPLASTSSTVTQFYYNLTANEDIAASTRTSSTFPDGSMLNAESKDKTGKSAADGVKIRDMSLMLRLAFDFYPTDRMFLTLGTAFYYGLNSAREVQVPTGGLQDSRNRNLQFLVGTGFIIGGSK